MNRAAGVLLSLAIAGVFAGCGDDDGGSSSASVPTNAYFISMKGGSGTSGSGGSGGYFQVFTSGWKGIHVKTAGTVDTAFALPQRPQLELGDNPLVVSADMSIPVYATQALAQAATADLDYYMYVGNLNIWLRDSSAGDSAVTGVQVKRNAALTLPLNRNENAIAGEESCRVSFDDDVDIQGEVIIRDLSTGTTETGATSETRQGTAVTSIDRAYFYLYSNYNIFIGRYGVIDNSGGNAAAANQRGGVGGYVYLDGNSAVYCDGTIDVSGGNGNGTGAGGHAGTNTFGNAQGIYCHTARGTIVNTGSMTANGGTGATAGNAGYIMLDSEGYLYNTGALTSNGGDATSGSGTSGNIIYLYANDNSAFNRGALTTNGGDGTAAGGSGGDIYIEGGSDSEVGDAVNAGKLTANGGQGGTGTGGSGGYIWMEANGGDVRTSGAISMVGGDSTGSTGGSGGELQVDTFDSYDYGNSESVMPGSVYVGGTIQVDGGDGASGGSGGEIYLYPDDFDRYNYAPEYGIYVLGYSRIEADGGNGTTGGDGGDIDLYTEYGEFPDSYYKSGPVNWNVRIDADGGNGTAGTGGNGGYFYVEGTEGGYIGDTVTVKANMSLTGGDGSTSGGAGGYFSAYSHEKLTVGGTIDVSGGDGTGTNASGGHADSNTQYIYGTRDVALSGKFIAKGGQGQGTGDGGYGGDIYVYAGYQTKLGMTLDFRGGSTVDGWGGDGGYIETNSQRSPTVKSAGWNVDEGTGASGDGTHGEVWLDWVNVER